jgi:hypothetical protein
VRRSRTRDYAERILKAIGNKAYRCEECDWRGFVWRRGGAASYHEENYWAYQWTRRISAVLLILVVIFVCYYLMTVVLR